MTIPNRITLDDLPTMPVGEIAALPGDQLVLEAKFLSAKRSIWKFECRASVDGKEVCSAEIICAERKL